MAKVALSARIPDDLDEQIKQFALARDEAKTDAVVALLRLGLLSTSSQFQPDGGGSGVSSINIPLVIDSMKDEILNAIWSSSLCLLYPIIESSVRSQIVARMALPNGKQVSDAELQRFVQTKLAELLYPDDENDSDEAEGNAS
ncbi:hypothetical protein [Paraburkholderia phenazinium]|uniref:hypothetical protein n=1 Tax=Paraburkholderia phenazinium TaxID=60549 RepID=UPI00158C14C7|nr:hypothetical protein [Paraburkholderia phenazinium]